MSMNQYSDFIVIRSGNNIKLCKLSGDPPYLKFPKERALRWGKEWGKGHSLFLQSSPWGPTSPFNPQGPRLTQSAGSFQHLSPKLHGLDKEGEDLLQVYSHNALPGKHSILKTREDYTLQLTLSPLLSGFYLTFLPSLLNTAYHGIFF